MWCLRLFLHLNGRRRLSNYTSTIYALSSGHGKCGVAVIRVSGSNAGKAILTMTNLAELPKPRLAVLRHLHDPVTTEKLDRGLILWFPGPRSFTGEDCCEFQVHGGPAVVASVLTALGKLPGFRPAEAGEFTKRAFFNGKLDLTEIEGLGDLIHAETEMQRKQALLQMEGTLSNLYNRWRETLVKNIAHVEAFIDFSEDENIEENIMADVSNHLQHIKKEIEKHLADGRRGERLRHGVKTAIIGEPNAGKSSLFNALCQRPAAIVTPIPGTTRDLIEININMNGYPLVLVDTAGLRTDTTDFIEKEGIAKALSAIQTSDLLLIVVDSTLLKGKIKSLDSDQLNNFLKHYLECLNCSSEILMQKTDEVSKHQHKCIFIFNKMDLLTDNERLRLVKEIDERKMSCISCVTEDGFLSFTQILTEHLKDLCGSPSEDNPSLTQMRHRHHLTQCLHYLTEYFETTGEANLPIAAHKLRKSLNHIGKITGQITSDEILDVIFRDFCIGK